MNFKSYKDYINHLKKQTSDFKKATHTALKQATHLVWEETRGRYWVQQSWRPTQTSDTPLYKTWKLKDSVQEEIHTNYGRVYSENFLAKLHEYGHTFKMSDAQRKYLFAVVFKDVPYTWTKEEDKKWLIVIPARPIRREIAKDETLRVKISVAVDREIKLSFIDTWGFN